ncbi:MAG TPA: hypothetical protein ENO25_05065 [Desulfobacteraceae bacterium]|nr:hypothetical protein [Desulfobacteraceae bacterium]
MNKKRIAGLLLFMVSFPMLWFNGCGTAKSALELSAEAVKDVSDKILPGKEAVLKKRVLISPIMNQAGVDDEKIAMLNKRLEETLVVDSLITRTLSRGPAPSRAEMRTPHFGVIIDPDLVKKAEDMDMNVLITCTLNPFEIETKKSGIWPLHRVKRQVEISISLQAIDVTYGTLFFNGLENRKFKIDKDLSEKEEENWGIDDETLNEEFASILDDLSADLLDALRTLPWSGRIERFDNGTIRVNGGSDIGITEGSILEVYGKREEIRSVSGRSYYFLGPKDGEIRIEKVADHYSQAVPLGEEQFEVGQVVRIKGK